LFFTALTFFFLKKLADSLPILLYYPHEKSHAEIEELGNEIEKKKRKHL